MYCRKCGAQIADSARFCDKCGEEVILIKQRSYSEKYKEEKQLAKQSRKMKSKQKMDEKYKDLKNPYILPGLGTSVLAFTLAIFPYPRSWGIGTSLWLRIVIIVLALLADYHCTKAKQVNNLYESKYHYQIQPNIVKVSFALAVFTTFVSMFALFYY